MTAPFVIDAPGRICLFGEHQDYLGLEVIAAGIDRRLSLEARPGGPRGKLHLELPDLGETMAFDPATPTPRRHRRDYLGAALRVLQARGVVVPGGWRFRVTSTIPINAGCGSSSVLCLCWIAALLQAAGRLEEFGREELALLANRAEVVEFGESGGVMDHLAAAEGGLFLLDCRPPWRRRQLAAELPGLVLIHPGEGKETTRVVARARRRAQEALARARELQPDFDLRRGEVGPGLQVALALPPDLQPVLRGHLEGRVLCLAQQANLSRREPDLEALGAALTEHHRALAEGLGLSTPRIDHALALAKRAGALGGKLNGSGGGGTCFVLAPGRQKAVMAALAGENIPAWPVTPARGLHLSGSDHTNSF